MSTPLEEIARECVGKLPLNSIFEDREWTRLAVEVVLLRLEEVERQTVERCIRIVNEGIDHHWTCHYEGKICTCGKDPTIAELKKGSEGK